MLSSALKQRTIDAWTTYSDAMREAFQWPQGRGLEMLSIEQVFATNDSEAVEQFIEFCLRSASEMRKLKFVGER